MNSFHDGISFPTEARPRPGRASSEMSFDAIAPHYRWMEFVTAGSLLQRCRMAFLAELQAARNILLLGEGRGRFLVELLAVNPEARVTCVDASARMLEFMRACVRKRNLPEARVRFVHMDLLRTKSSAAVPAALGFGRRDACATLDGAASCIEPYDAVASHFFLDCFRPDQLESIAAVISQCTVPGARWLISDFCVPGRGWKRLRARLILASLYAFFRAVTHLPASRLTPPDEILQRAGFRLKQRIRFNLGLLHSDLWIKSQGEGGGVKIGVCVGTEPSSGT